MAIAAVHADVDRARFGVLIVAAVEILHDLRFYLSKLPRRFFVPALTGAQPRRRKLQHASQLQFAEQLFRRSFEPNDVNGFRKAI